ncbi:MAG: hypothetical protein JWM98_1084 [Thermoleophilia bacterium]|nr:hypothetical protein [Thermoleophilia bacterium]
MQQQSPFVKFVIWLMIFLMSVGFAALVVSPFLGGGNLFGGGDNGRSQTEDRIDEARADIRKDDCAKDGVKLKGKQLDRCKEALLTLASSYRTLAAPDDEGKQPRDAKRNIERSLATYETLYKIDPTDDDSSEAYAASLRDNGKAQPSLAIWTELVKRNPDNEDYLLQQASAYEGTQDLDKAIATYTAFVKKFPDSGQLDAIKDQIKTLKEQQAQQAASAPGAPGGAGAAGGGITATGPDGQPISIG